MRLNNGIELYIDEVQVQDAQAILSYLKTIGGETHFLSFGKEGIPMDVAQEETHIQTYLDHPINVQWKAMVQDEIVGLCELHIFANKRMQHRCEVSISVKQSHWHQGIAKAMMNHMMTYAHNQPQLKIISLEVLEDNQAAIALYESFGFQKVGYLQKFFCVDGIYYGAYVMDRTIV